MCYNLNFFRKYKEVTFHRRMMHTQFEIGYLEKLNNNLSRIVGKDKID